MVYLVKSPASPASKARQREAAGAVIDDMLADFSGIDEALENCGDLDDCVEGLYRDETTAVAVGALNQLNAWELGKTEPECRCIVLIEDDLRIFELVFGADWDRYILLTRYDSADQLRDAVESGRLPDALMDDETVSLESMVVFILLHETGHIGDYRLDFAEHPSAAALDGFLRTLTPEKIEEIRADAFVASVLRRGCFGRPPQAAEMEACLATPTMGMLTFVIGMKGKSREGRCLRYFDTVRGYPNWQARLLILGALYYPESGASLDLLQGYLDTRASLLEMPWVREIPLCAEAAQGR